MGPWDLALGMTNTAAEMTGQQQANKANERLHQNQLRWSEYMWHQQNEYNTPAAQMQRMREAGLNTSLMYGQGSPGNATTQAQGVNPPTMQNVAGGIGNTIRDYISLKRVNAEIENIEADTAVKLGTKDKNAWETEGIKINNARDYQEYQVETKTAGNRINQSQIETTAMGLQLLADGINIERGNIAKYSEEIDLAYKELNKIIQAAQSIADLEGTELINDMNREKLAYMIKNKHEMATGNMMAAVLSTILTGDNKNANAIKEITDKYKNEQAKYPNIQRTFKEMQEEGKWLK